MLTQIIQYSALQFSTFTHIHPSQVKNLSDQLILVDKKDNEIGSLSKLNSHLKSQNNQHPHRAFSVFLFNNKNELLLQQRSSKKVTFPLLWSNTCCSHPLNIPDERIFDVVEKVIDIYAENGQGRERLGNYIDRIGLDEFKKLLNIEEFLKA